MFHSLKSSSLKGLCRVESSEAGHNEEDMATAGETEGLQEEATAQEDTATAAKGAQAREARDMAESEDTAQAQAHHLATEPITDGKAAEGRDTSKRPPPSVKNHRSKTGGMIFDTQNSTDRQFLRNRRFLTVIRNFVSDI